MIKIKLDKPFKFDNTITCGQIFRYIKNEDYSYDIILKDRVINVFVKNDYLYASSNNDQDLKKIIINYFDLENDYESINKYLIKNDEKIKDAVIFSDGFKIIRQDPFETLISYIISANNGVPQITNALNNIAKKYGKKVMFNNKEYYLFPDYKDLKDVKIEEFRNCKVGFRDKYIKSIIDKLNNNEISLEESFKLNTNDALLKLMENKGIGMKVASCILLFSYQKYDVFPVDTWVKKVMKRKYNIEGEKKIREFAKEKYDKYSGIAIQYMFNYGRNKEKE